MAAFLFVVWDGGGTVPPALGLARLLVDRGHVVRVLGSRWLGPRVEAAGATFRPFDEAPEPDPSPDLAIEDQLTDYLELWFGHASGRDLTAELAREPADAVVIDCMFANLLAYAEHLDVPAAVLVHLLYQPVVDGRWLDGWTWALEPLNRLRRELGLDGFGPSVSVWADAWGRAARALVTTTAAFDDPGPVAPNARYVGPIREPVETQADDDDDVVPADGSDPFVVVSLSSSYMHQEQMLERILDAVAELPVRALVTAGHRVDLGGLRAPANTIIRPWVPHDIVLPHAALVVTHAGHGTTMAALTHGVPLVCIPMGRDQHLVAARVESCGVGRALSDDAAIDQVRAAIEEVLGASHYRKEAATFAADIATYGGGRSAVDELEAITG